MEEQTAYQVAAEDNAATALDALKPGAVTLRGAASSALRAREPIPAGHKLAVRDIPKGAAIIKYGVVIGRAVEDIPAGCWVHLPRVQSLYDERSGHLDPNTGAPLDTRYE